MVKIVWTGQALQDLNDIGDYIANDSDRYAQEVVQSLFESVHILEHHPKGGRMVPEYKHSHLREIITGSYNIDEF